MVFEKATCYREFQ